MITLDEIVERANALCDAQGVYPKGCSDFVCQVVQMPWRSADEIMGDAPPKITDWKPIVPGCIVGWKANTGTPASAHVAIFIDQNQFIDVREPGPKSKPRRLSNYGRSVFIASGRYR